MSRGGNATAAGPGPLLSRLTKRSRLLLVVVKSSSSSGGVHAAGWMVAPRATELKFRLGSPRVWSFPLILMQDDFWHFQSMLARAIDRCTWWMPSEFHEAQASVEDRKTVFAALPDREIKSNSQSDTNIVASAQGWVDYLISCRAAVTGNAPRVDQDTVETMQMTFSFLETGRTALAVLARRRLLARRCPDCAAPPSTESRPQRAL